MQAVCIKRKVSYDTNINTPVPGRFPSLLEKIPKQTDYEDQGFNKELNHIKNQ